MFRSDIPISARRFHALTKSLKQPVPKLLDLRLASGLALLSHMTFQNFMADGLGLSPDKQKNLRRAYEVAGTFSENPRGWLLLKGGIGSGKTHLAAAIANARLLHAEPALFIVVPDLLDHLRATYAPGSAVTYDERFESIRNAFSAHPRRFWRAQRNTLGTRKIVPAPQLPL